MNLHLLGTDLQGYDDRSDSDGDKTPPRASRRIPVTDLDEDDYGSPDYYQENLRKIDPHTKVCASVLITLPNENMSLRII